MTPAISWRRPYFSASSVPNDHRQATAPGETARPDEGHGGLEIEGFPRPSSNAPPLVPRVRGGAARVEAQDGEIGERRETSRRLAQDVRVHESARRGQRMQRQQRRDGGTLEGHGELPHEV